MATNTGITETADDSTTKKDVERPAFRPTSNLGDGVDDVIEHCKSKRAGYNKHVCCRSELLVVDGLPWPEMSNTDVSFPLSSPSTALKTPWSFLEN